MITTIGEMLADFVPEGWGYLLRPGGAPFNVAVNLARWGAGSAIMSRVGDDFLGRFLLDFARKNRVDVSCVRITKGYKTGLVFVFLDKTGERDFSFYGSPSADTMLSAENIDEAKIKKSSIVHFGSISLMSVKSAAATLKAIKLAKKYGKLISYDPNYRPNLWIGKEGQARKLIKNAFDYADIIKISDFEFEFLFKTNPNRNALSRIFGDKKLVFISAGSSGCFVRYGDIFFHSPAKKVKAVDTTGAGDAFMAGVLFMVEKKGACLNFGRHELQEIADFANQKGAEAVKRKGAV